MIRISVKGIQKKSPVIFSCRLLWVLTPTSPVSWDRQALPTTQTGERVRERKGKHATTGRGEEGVLDLSNMSAKKTANGIKQRGLNSTRGPRSFYPPPSFSSKSYRNCTKGSSDVVKEWESFAA